MCLSFLFGKDIVYLDEGNPNCTFSLAGTFMNKLVSLILLLSVFAISSVSIQDSQHKTVPCEVKAFPGAMGFGTYTPGGRGGKIIYVTNLNDSGEGSLRNALTESGPRLVLFRVSGTITLEKDIVIKEPFLTIAGQTAPGEGVQIRGAQIHIETHDIIIRYLKVRSGDLMDASTEDERDAITINKLDQAYNIVIDHSTMIWGPDIGGLSFLNGTHDATVSYSIMGEGLYLSHHPEGVQVTDGHSMAMNITELDSPIPPRRITAHHNLLTTSADRNPRVIGGENIDIVNNVIYNWKNSASQGNPRSLNLINNTYILGPMTSNPLTHFIWMPKVEAGGSLHYGSVYETGNVTEGFDKQLKSPMDVYVDTRFSPYSMMSQEDSPETAYNKVLRDAGANLQVSTASGDFRIIRDSVDQRIIENVLHRTGTLVNGVDYDNVAGFPAISWPALQGGREAIDDDLDGMPDAWEQIYFRNTQRGSPESSNRDYDRDGYTDVEEYLNRTNPVRPEMCRE
jgi:pectate lyase